MVHAKKPEVGDKVNYVGHYYIEEGMIVILNGTWNVTIDMGDGSAVSNVPYNDDERVIQHTWNYA